MNNEDHAIVIGVSRYPCLGETAEQAIPPLLGPDRDAQAIYDWLTDPAKGGVPKKNAKLFRSADYPDPFPDPAADTAQPQADAIEDELSRLARLTEGSGSPRIGRRLYLYAAGHGFSTDEMKSAVIMADATRKDLNQRHITLSEWARSFARTGSFAEVVLWMDCCMRKYNGALLRPGGLPDFVQNDGGGQLFAIFAARYPMSAIELEFPGDGVHGVFTHLLLRALNGEAATAGTNEITTASIAAFLYDAMPALLKQRKQDKAGVSPVPNFMKQDPLTITKVLAPSKHPYTLALPAAAIGKTVRIVTGAAQTVETRVVGSEAEVFHLPTGAYVALVDEIDWRHGFTPFGGNHA